jgi:hypothetical protein
MKSYKSSLDNNNITPNVEYQNIVNNDLNSRIIKENSDNFSNFAEEAFKCK